MQPGDLLSSLLFVFLYAETHYRFPYFFSWLKKSEPEIIADIPSRIEHGKNMPVLIIIKDANHYPVQLKEIQVWCNDMQITCENYDESVNRSYYEKICNIDTKKFNPGTNAINVRIEYQIKGKSRSCLNDNHRGTSHAPLPLYISESEIPRIGNALIGETHAHTYYTSDQVEFAASVTHTALLAEAMGLDFYCATDHSYDMDDMPDNYLVNDPNFQKWDKFKSEVETYNSTHSNFVIIPGEEVSIRNHNGRNVHCLVYNSNKFFPGSGDSAERWFRWRSELSLEELTSMVEKRAYIFAAHPFEDSPFLQRLFIGRDRWTDSDCTNTDIHGLQFINGANSQLTEQAKNDWVRLLLQGHRITGIAGNDAHGNFARFRQVGFPFFTMREHYDHLFGKWFTGIYHFETGTKEEILAAMSSGNCYLSNGPAIKFMACNKTGEWISTGNQIDQIEKLQIQVKSSREFGRLKSVKIYSGDISRGTEKIVYEKV